LGEKVPTFYSPEIVRFFSLDQRINKQIPIWWTPGVFNDPVVGPIPVIFLIEESPTNRKARVFVLVWPQAKFGDRAAFTALLNGYSGEMGDVAVRLSGIGVMSTVSRSQPDLYFAPLHTSAKLISPLWLNIFRGGVADVFLRTAPSWPYALDNNGLSPTAVGTAGRSTGWL
jgi:hypothetical protein